jgi:predicted RNase H-like HicB family nuclease
MKTYFAIVHKDPGSAFGIAFPDVPGCFSAGDTFEEAIANAAEALRLHRDVSAETGRNFPEPRSFDDLMADASLRSELTDSPLVPVSLPSPGDVEIEVKVSLEPILLDRIDEAAQRKGLSRSAFLSQAARTELAS